jgi:hypothetical protein
MYSFISISYSFSHRSSLTVHPFIKLRSRKGLDYQRAMSYHAGAGLVLATRDDFAEFLRNLS